jgi:hypothetical protein
MFPIAIIAGVIGAVVSTAQGASWVSDQVNSSTGTVSAGGKTEAKAQTATSTSPFEAALAAQVAGQSVQASPAVTTSSSNVTPSQQVTDYDTLQRTQAGIAAYGRVGEHHAKTPTHASDGAVTAS